MAAAAALAAGTGAAGAASPVTAPVAESPADPERDELARLWSGIYDITEERVAGIASSSPLAPLTEQQRIQVHIRRVSLPALGSHVLILEEFPFDQPLEARRRVWLSIEPARALDGALRIRQFTHRAGAADPASLTPADLESMAGCDLYLRREGAQFRGGTRGRQCLDDTGDEPRWLDHRLVIGDGLFWYRQRRLSVTDHELTEEFAGFPHVDLDEARLFSCGLRWRATGTAGGADRRALDSVDLHDRGGRARVRTPDGRDLLLELHGRDWPLSEGRESLVLTLTDARTDETLGSSWTSLGAARVGMDLGWLAIDCAPEVSETGERRS